VREEENEKTTTNNLGLDFYFYFLSPLPFILFLFYFIPTTTLGHSSFLCRKYFNGRRQLNKGGAPHNVRIILGRDKRKGSATKETILFLLEIITTIIILQSLHPFES